MVVLNITGGEDALNARVGSGTGGHVVVLVEIYLTVNHGRVWHVTNSDEDTGHVDHAGLTRHGIDDLHARDLLLAVNLFDLRVPRELNFGVSQCPLLHDLAGA